MNNKYKLFGKEISGIFTIPSGIVNTEIEVLEKIGNEIPEIGILTTKSIGPEPREGNKEPILVQHAPFSFMNSVDLTNPGADEFAKKLQKVKIPKQKNILNYREWRNGSKRIGDRQFGRDNKKSSTRILYKLWPRVNDKRCYSKRK